MTSKKIEYNNADVAIEYENYEDNQIIVDLEKLAKPLKKQMEKGYLQIPLGESILNKLILLALPSPSQRLH